ncbi:MAG: extracellular solute-binding protein [Chloroflexi bacterium]|nr:extracellular solute-binding protein [Chloroflexota bacterium]
MTQPTLAMRKIRGVVGLLLLTLVVVAVAAACGQDEPTATPVPTATATPVPGAIPTPTPEPTPTPSEAELFQIEWEQLITEAQAEGEVVIILSAPASRNNRVIFDSFGEKFGITVLQSTGSGTTNVNRVLAERGRGVYTVDVSVVGASSTDRLRVAGAIVPIEPLIIHPEVNDRSQGWLLTEWAWTDVDNKYSPAFNLRLRENIVEIFYNTNEVSQAEIDSVLSWKDFLKPEWKGRIAAIIDPGFGGATTDRTLVWILLGQEWLEPFIRNQEPFLLPGGSFADMANGLARGKYHIAMFTGAASTDMEAMMALGLPVGKLTRTLSEGGTVEIRGTLTILESAPHPKAAQLFVNWYLSREGQQARLDLTEDSDVSPSLRTDLTQGKVSDRQWEQFLALDPASAISQSTPEWFVARDGVNEWLVSIYTELGIGGY